MKFYNYQTFFYNTALAICKEVGLTLLLMVIVH